MSDPIAVGDVENPAALAVGSSQCCSSENNKYTHCMSWYKVQSMWMAQGDAKPYLGELNVDQHAEEYVLVFRCRDENIDTVVRLIKENHPYEEVCIDIHRLM